jgi:hypothetical protein
MENTTLSLEAIKEELKASFAKAGFSRQKKPGEKFIWYKRGMVVDSCSKESVAILASKFIAKADQTIAECGIAGVERKDTVLDISDTFSVLNTIVCELRIPASQQ